MELGLESSVLVVSQSSGDLLQPAEAAGSSGAYGMRTLRSLRNSKPSGRLQKKIDVTYNYFLEEVDTVIGDCITHLLCLQPKDVPKAMLKYLKKRALEKKIAEQAADATERNDIGEVDEADEEEEDVEDGGKSPRPKKEHKLYLAMSIGPVVAKLVNRVAITRPKRVVDFLCRELNVMIFGPSVAEAGADDGSNLDEVDERFAVYGTFVPGKKPQEPSVPPTDQLEQPDVPLFPEEPASDEPSASVEAEPKAMETSVVSSTVETNVVVVEEPKAPLRNLQLALLGMDNAGKSSILNALQGISDTKTRPTIGFRPIAMMLDAETRVRFYDLGGGAKIRDIWNQYYHDVHAVVYVIDSSDAERMVESVQLFKATMKNAYLAGKPLLVFANKNDVAGAKSSEELATLLDLASPEYPTAKIVSCCAKEGLPLDAEIERTLGEVLSTVQSSYEQLNERVDADTKQKARDEARKRLERERKVLRNKIACAFPDSVNPAFKPELPPSPEDSFTVDEGVTFLAAEIGEDAAGLPSVALDLARMVGYQRLALQIIGALKAPIKKSKDPMKWDEIYALVVELRTELGLLE